MRLLPYCYERVSSKDQVVSGGGLDDQRSQIEQFLARRASEFTEERIFIRDEGVSAFKDANISPASNLGKFLQDVKDGKIGEGAALVVTSLDRLSRRNAWEESTMQFIVNSDIAIFDASLNMKFHKDDPFTKIIMELVGLRGNNESLVKSIRSKVAWESKLRKALENGQVISNRMPRWLRNQDNRYEVIEEQKTLITFVFDSYINGLSTGEIVSQLDNDWRLVTVSKLLRDRRLIGEHVRGNGDVFHNVYPVIVDREKFNIVQTMLDARQPATVNKAKDLLSNQDEVRTIFSLYEEGLSVGQIVRRIKNDWSTANVLRVLRDENVVEKEIIDNLTFKRVSDALTKKGVAKKVRKDITRAENDVITNLFSGNLHCGMCGGRIALHYNHLKTKYVSCRNREEKKTCNAKSVQYTNIERNILETVKQVDFASLVSNQDMDLHRSNIKSELDMLRVEEQRYIAAIEKRRQEKKRVSFDLSNGLEETRDAIEDFEKQLSTSDTNAQPEFLFDIEEALNPENLELRAQLRKELKHVVSKIHYTRFDKYIQIRIDYHVDVIRHVLIINNKGGTLAANIAIHSKDNVYSYETASFTLIEDRNTNICSIDESYDISIQDYGLLMNYMQGIANQSIISYMAMNMSDIINK